MRFVMERNEPDRANCWHNGIRRWLLWWTIVEVQIVYMFRRNQQDECCEKSTEERILSLYGAYIKFVPRACIAKAFITVNKQQRNYIRRYQ